MSESTFPTTLADPQVLGRLTAPVELWAPVHDYASWLSELRVLSDPTYRELDRAVRKAAFDRCRDGLRSLARPVPVDGWRATIALISMLSVSSATGSPFLAEEFAPFVKAGGPTGNDLVKAIAARLDDLYVEAARAPAGPVAFAWIARAARLHPGVAMHAGEPVRIYLQTLEDVVAGRPVGRGTVADDRVLAHLKGWTNPVRIEGAPSRLVPSADRLRLALGGHYARINGRAAAYLVAMALIGLTFLAGLRLFAIDARRVARFETTQSGPLSDVLTGEIQGAPTANDGPGEIERRHPPERFFDEGGDP